ncbi:MAG: hypothetical protein U0X40_06305 [Ferruginibacter sp.]
MATKQKKDTKKEEQVPTLFLQDRKLFTSPAPLLPPALEEMTKLLSPSGGLLGGGIPRIGITKYIITPLRLMATGDIYAQPEGLLWFLDSNNLIFMNDEYMNKGQLSIQLTGFPPKETFGGIKLSAKHWNPNNQSSLGEFRIQITGQNDQWVKATGAVQTIGFHNPAPGARKFAWPGIKISLVNSNAMWTFHNASIFVKS